MRKAKIEKALNRKISKWLDSIEDETLRNDLKSGVIVTGGCIVSMLTGDEVSDYDVYFRTKELAKRVAIYYVAKFNETHNANAWVVDGEDVENAKDDTEVNKKLFPGITGNLPRFGYIPKDRIKIFIKSRGIAEDSVEESEAQSIEMVILNADEISAAALEEQDSTKPPYRPVFMSGNAITLSDKVQLVLRFYGEPDEIHKNYDFLHCTCYWTSWEKEVHWTTEALDAIINKELYYMGSKYPICSIIRTRKFINRGWSINAGQYLKMAFQVSELNLSDLDTLEDQLTGVDSAYFMNAIEQLRKLSDEKTENGESFSFDSTYLATIVDKVFK